MPNEDDETIIIVPELRIIRLVPTPSEALTTGCTAAGEGRS
jgi:hypothetical protein